MDNEKKRNKIDVKYTNTNIKNRAAISYLVGLILLEHIIAHSFQFMKHFGICCQNSSSLYERCFKSRWWSEQ